MQRLPNGQKKVIDLGFHRLNPSYEEVFVNYAQDKYDSKESIWEVEFWGNGTGVYNVTGGSVGINNGIAYSATGTLGFGFSQGMVRPHPWLYRLYDADDKRRDWAIAPYRYGTAGKESFPPTSLLIERFCGKFRRENELVLPKTNTQTPQNFPLVRYADVLLMAAEGINESENSATHALPYLNKVRRRAKGIDVEGGNVSVDLTGLSSEQLRSEIKNERARELCFEALRKNDLIRWGISMKR